MSKNRESEIQRDKMADEIIKAASKVSGIRVDTLVGYDRRQKIFRVRALTMLAVREDASLSWSATARKFGWRHHTSIIYAVEQAQKMELLETYQKILSDIRLEVAISTGKKLQGQHCDICNGPCVHYQA